MEIVIPGLLVMRFQVKPFKDPPGQVRSLGGSWQVSHFSCVETSVDRRPGETSCETGHHRPMFPMREEGEEGGGSI